eukprot:TRINITY_DN22512_c0_g1_i1.p1 TRINITY_DN22512_c0_g1~~TRINITY_DN22512_c0_g1_i1.p1  ORF type:complete len:174 (+),score=21.71 TRINITY_DN22512_c0_g1_i1:203-724(+)
MGGGTMAAATVRKLSEMDPYARKCAALEKEYDAEEDKVLDLTGHLREKKLRLQRLRVENRFLQERLDWFESNRGRSDCNPQIELRTEACGAAMPVDASRAANGQGTLYEQAQVMTRPENDASGMLILHSNIVQPASPLMMPPSRSDSGCHLFPDSGMSPSPLRGEAPPITWHL